MIIYAKTIDSKYVLFDESEENLLSFVGEYKSVFGEKPSMGKNAVISPEVFEKKLNGKLWSIADNMNEKATIYISDFKPNYDVISSDDVKVKKVKNKNSIVKQKKENIKMSDENTVKVPSSLKVADVPPVKQKRHRRSPAEMAAARVGGNGKVAVKVAKPAVTQKSSGALVSRIMVLDQAIMFIYNDGTIKDIPVNKAPIYRVDPKTGQSTLLS
jgi:hypothetical protein